MRTAHCGRELVLWLKMALFLCDLDGTLCVHASPAEWLRPLLHHCFLLVFVALFIAWQENLGNLRARAFEAKRWVLVRLDSLGQAPDIDSDCDCDLEAG